jgi:hypothetical protein
MWHGACGVGSPTKRLHEEGNHHEVDEVDHQMRGAADADASLDDNRRWRSAPLT